MINNSVRNTSLTTTDWTASRGEKWSAKLDGMEAMLAPVDEPLIRALNLDAPCRIADIGCGGGGTALEIFRRAPKGSIVNGFDLSQSSIKMARNRSRSDERAIAFNVVDMEVEGPPEGTYDRLVSRFGIMFFDDPHAAFANLFHWLVPGGRFAFAVWSCPAENPWMTSVRQVVAGLIDLPPSDPEASGPFRYAETDKLLSLLALAGFGALDVNDWRGVLPIGGGLRAEEAATFALASFSSFGELLAQAGDAALSEARRSLTTRLSRHEQDGVVQMGACVHIITGERSR